MTPLSCLSLKRLPCISTILGGLFIGCLVHVSPYAFAEDSITNATAQKISEQVKSQADGADDAVVTIDPDMSRALLKRFKKENPGAREHVLHKVSDAYVESNENPGVKLERVWVGEKGTLLEITGLPRVGNSNSAVMRSDTLHLLEQRGTRRNLIAFEGVTELRDSRGGSALVLKPGETLYLLMEPVDDYRPFLLKHSNWNGTYAAYFEDIDPRFRERYDAAFKAATTPETMKDFLVEFAKNDPDKRAPGVFYELIQRMRAQKTFEGYYNAYLLLQEPQDATLASRLAKTEGHKAMIEHMAVATLVDKTRLIDFDLRLDSTSTSSSEGSCFFACNYNFTATRPVRGTLTVRAKKSGAPITLKHGTYTVTINSSMRLPRYGQRRSGWLGDFNGANDQEFTNKFKVTLSPPHYTASIPVDLGKMTVAFFERGSMGGYSAIWANGDATATLTFNGMELQ